MSHSIPFAVLAFSMSFAGSALAAESAAPVSLNKAEVPPMIAKAVEAKAAEGIGALRQYVQRTRMVHALSLRTLVRDGDAEAIARNEEKVQVAQR